MGFKKLVKKAASSVVKTVAQAPKTFVETAKDAGKSTLNFGKAAVGGNGGNYFKGLGNAAADLGASAANVAVTNMTVGTTSLNSKGGTNNLDNQVGKMIGSSISGGDTVAPPTTAGAAEMKEDPFLKEEMENSRRKGRASTIFGGSSDLLGTKSNKRGLFGSF